MATYPQFIEAFGMPGGWEWIVVLIIALLIFGRKLPDVARSIGKSLNAFKRGLHEVEDEVEETKDEINREVGKVKEDMANEKKNTGELNDTPHK